jgi:hypothetical protein
MALWQQLAESLNRPREPGIQARRSCSSKDLALDIRPTHGGELGATPLSPTYAPRERFESGRADFVEGVIPIREKLH